MKIHFKSMTTEDVDLWFAWSKIPHVKDVWFIEGYEPVDYIHKKIAGNGYDLPFIIMLDDKPIGFIQACDLYAYRTQCENPKGVFTQEDEGTFCLDLFIAEESLLNKGLGTQIVKLFTEKLFDEFNAKKIMIDPAASNARAIRCYEKVGFFKVREEYDGVESAIVMELKR